MTIHDFESALKQNNLRLTEPRRMVFESLNKSNRALSPKEVFDSLKDKTDLASVYRNLGLFKDIGLVHSLSDGVYSLCRHEHSSHDHVHVILNCNSCGLTQEVKEHQKGLCEASNALLSFSKPLTGVDSILLKGMCESCSDKS